MNRLKVWIRKNLLTPDPNDFTAVVSPVGSINKEGLVDAVIAEGTEYQRETVNDIVTRYNRQCARHSVSGWNVDTGLVYMRPVVTGPIYGMTLDPAKNSVYVSAVQGADIRKEIAQTTVEILGEMPDVMFILQVINMKTKAGDGTLARGWNAQVEGSYIKVAGDDPAVGVYLVSTADGTETKLDTDYIVVNDPSKLMILVPPDLPEAGCRLKIVTQYTGAGKLLKAPREKTFDQELAVV